MYPTYASVEAGESYEVTCTTGFTLTGVSTMTCQNDASFDQTPTCEGKALLLRSGLSGLVW